MKRRGLTVLEVLIASLIGGLVSLALFKLVGTVDRSAAKGQNRFTAHAAMDDLFLNSIKRYFSSRLADASCQPASLACLCKSPSVDCQFVDSAGFSPTGTGNCQDLKISVHTSATNLSNVTTYFFTTTCGGALPSALPVHPHTACAGKVSSMAILVSQSSGAPLPALTSPLRHASVSHAVCFRAVSPTEIAVEVGALPGPGPKDAPLFAKYTLSTDDRPPGVEFMPQ